MPDLLEKLSLLDPRFAVARGLPADADRSWLAAERLADAGSTELAAALDAETHASGHVSRHAAALSMIAAYACTVPTAAVAGWALTGEVLDMRAVNVAVQLGDHHGFEAYAVREVVVRDGGVERLVDEVLVEHLLPIAEAMHEATRAGRRQLLGGIGFGLAAAFTVLSWRGQDIDPLRRRYDELVAATGSRTGVDLDELGQLQLITAQTDGTGPSALFYFRRTCCLVYTSAEDGLCASCCLTPESERLATYRAALN